MHKELKTTEPTGQPHESGQIIPPDVLRQATDRNRPVGETPPAGDLQTLRELAEQGNGADIRAALGKLNAALDSLSAKSASLNAELASGQAPTEQLRTGYAQLKDTFDQINTLAGPLKQVDNSLWLLDANLQAREASEANATVCKLYGEWVEQSLSEGVPQSAIDSGHSQLASEIGKHLPAIEAYYRPMSLLDARDHHINPLTHWLDTLPSTDNPQVAAVITQIQFDLEHVSPPSTIHIPYNKNTLATLEKTLRALPSLRELTREH